MVLKNVSKTSVVLADPSAHYYTFRVGESVPLADTLLQVGCVQQMIRDGYLVVVKDAQGAVLDSTHITELKKGKVHKVDRVISHIASSKEGIIVNDGVVTKFDPASSSDYVADDQPPTSLLPTPKKGKIEVLGRTVAKVGRRKKVVDIIKPVDDTQAVIKKGRVIKMQGDGGSVALDSGDSGLLVVNESGVPGQGKAVPIHELATEDLAQIAKSTNAILTEAEREKKLAVYMTGDEAVRQIFVDRTTDLAFLKQIATIEWEGNLAKAVRQKIAKIEG